MQPKAQPSSTPPLEVYLLEIVDYDDVSRLQRRLVYELGERPGGALILCEHPPIITIGRAGSRAHIQADDVELREMRIPVRWVNRGGGCVLHMPGQLSVYLTLSLQELNLNVGDYLSALHRIILTLLREFDLSGRLRPDVPGVYLSQSRVASIGVAVHRWIAYYGMTLNVGPFLAPFNVLREETPDGQRLWQTSMEARRQRPTPMAKVRETLIRTIEAEFGLESHHVYTSHPSIRSKARPNVYAPSLG